MKGFRLVFLLFVCFLFQGCTPSEQDEAASIKACGAMLKEFFAPSPQARADRFQAKVAEAVARCRGGQKAVQGRVLPWVDWGNYFGTGDASSKEPGIVISEGPLSPAGRGVAGALLDLEVQRVELIKYNLFDNNGTFRTYIL